MKIVKTIQLSAIFGGKRKAYAIDGLPLSDLLFADIQNTLSIFSGPDLFKKDLVIQTRDAKGGERTQLWSFYDHEKLFKSYWVNLTPDGHGGTYFSIIFL